MNSEIDSLAQIYQQNFPLYLRERQHMFKKSLSKYDHVDTLIHGNSVCGFGLMNVLEKYGMLHLDYMALDKSHQGKGNGSMYLKQLIHDYYDPHSKTIKYMILECEDYLVPFYKKNNFHKLNVNYKFKDTKLNLMIYGRSEYLRQSNIMKLAKYMTTLFMIHDCTLQYILLLTRLTIAANEYRQLIYFAYMIMMTAFIDTG